MVCSFSFLLLCVIIRKWWLLWVAGTGEPSHHSKPPTSLCFLAVISHYTAMCCLALTSVGTWNHKIMNWPRVSFASFKLCPRLNSPLEIKILVEKKINSLLFSEEANKAWTYKKVDISQSCYVLQILILKTLFHPWTFSFSLKGSLAGITIFLKTN